MPVYHFTFHAYLSWLPDRSQGYVHHARGLQPSNANLADLYRREASHDAAEFSAEHQSLMIDAILVAAKPQRFDAVAIGTDPTHLHLLLQWRDERPWNVLRNGVKSSMSRGLNQRYGRRPWFVENASRKRVVEQKHYELLIHKYIPGHVGWKWDVKRGKYR